LDLFSEGKNKTDESLFLFSIVLSTTNTRDYLSFSFLFGALKKHCITLMIVDCYVIFSPDFYQPPSSLVFLEDKAILMFNRYHTRITGSVKPSFTSTIVLDFDYHYRP